MKTKAHFNDKSVCRTIGYHVVPRIDYETDTGEHFPPLAVLFVKIE